MRVRDLIFPEGSSNQQPETALRVLGIDLGTTNSTVAEIVYDPKNDEEISVRCLAVEQPTGGRSHWSPLVPSMVALHDGQEFIGEGVRLLRINGRMKRLGEKRNLFSSVKNDMGLRRTYDMAPEGYRSAAEVSGKILGFLKEAALKEKSQLPERTIVTVPASFQLDQRSDTIKAATLAGMTLKGGDLLDEPVAAFIGYLSENPDEELVGPGQTKNLLVFDFGGGTCDVAILRLSRQDKNKRLSIATLSVSRYHRLGGGDIDQAILYEILMPQLLKQNDLHRNDLDFNMKKDFIEPALIGVAEKLKIELCDKVFEALREGENYDKFTHTCHGEYLCRLADGRTLTLCNPVLSVAQFEEIMYPFLEPYLLFNSETEYRQTLSIFAPIQDAVEKSGLTTEEIDICLLAGGSCLIPQVVIMVQDVFPDSTILNLDTPDTMQTAIACGAALNSLSLALTGFPIIQPVCQETIAIITSNGPFELVPKGASLPWPSNGGFEEVTTLTMPETSLQDPISVRVEVVAQEEGGSRPLVSELWQIPAPVSAGEGIRLEYRYDENQVLEIRLSHSERDDVKPFIERKDHPLTHIVNPQAVKLRIEDTEEKLRTGEIEPEERYKTIISLASDCAELRQYEKAISRLSELQRKRCEPDAVIINRMGLYWGNLGNREKEEYYYREASKIDPSWNIPWFNLAHAFKNHKRLDEAKSAIEKAIALKPESAPSYVLQGQIVRDMGKEFAMHEFLEIAMKRFRPLEQVDEWDLSWYQAMAEMKDNQELVRTVRHERQMRKVSTHEEGREMEGLLPALAA
ncbi:MAG: Hsp70 family protein [Geobacteraceae bacterium]|nr:Hsp70 family protein [Geobacteraceae bacterium]